MATLGPYEIHLHQLKPGEHRFGFQLNSALLEPITEPLMQDLDVAVQLRLHKGPTLYDLHLNMAGKLLLPCDRCLELAWQHTAFTHRLVYATDADLQELEGEEVAYLSPQQLTLDLAADFYELVSLRVPYRRVPCEDKAFACFSDTDTYLADATKSSSGNSQTEDAAIDPRWSKLRELGNNAY